MSKRKSSGASVTWKDTTIGVTTDENGAFSLPYSKENHLLVISYVGYETQTVEIHEPKAVKINIKPTKTLGEVVVQTKRNSLQKSYVKTANVVTMSSKELLKAACCNLSESFETNATVDVSYANAVSGTKQLKMLGLDQKYILIRMISEKIVSDPILL